MLAVPAKKYVRVSTAGLPEFTSEMPQGFLGYLKTPGNRLEVFLTDVFYLESLFPTDIQQNPPMSVRPVMFLIIWLQRARPCCTHDQARASRASYICPK